MKPLVDRILLAVLNVIDTSDVWALSRRDPDHLQLAVEHVLEPELAALRSQLEQERASNTANMAELHRASDLLGALRSRAEAAEADLEKALASAMFDRESRLRAEGEADRLRRFAEAWGALDPRAVISRAEKAEQ